MRIICRDCDKDMDVKQIDAFTGLGLTLQRSPLSSADVDDREILCDNCLNERICEGESQDDIMSEFNG
jgi:hypothetical protein